MQLPVPLPFKVLHPFTWITASKCLRNAIQEIFSSKFGDSIFQHKTDTSIFTGLDVFFLIFQVPFIPLPYILIPLIVFYFFLACL